MLRLLDRGLAVVSWIAAAFVVVLLFAGPSLIGAKKSGAAASYSGAAASNSGAAASKSGAAASKSGAAGPPSGGAVFASAGCGNCHTLKAAGASGTIGPNLDQLRPTAATVSQIVRTGSGEMPSFSGKLSEAEIAAVATYVSTVAGH
jgi:mono/diheme cytochrome c family protein